MTASGHLPGDGYGPYVGLRAFEPGEHALFFGRARESLELARLWRARKLTVLYGASGVGKTSLLQAGVLPSLDATRCDAWPVGRVRGPEATTGVITRNPYSFALLSSWAPEESAAALADITILDFLNQRSESHDRYGDPIPLLVAIDQFEELFNDTPDGRPFLRPFIDELSEALRGYPGARLLISLREDYLAAMLRYEQALAGQSRIRSRLLPFDREAAMEAITGPLKDTGRSFDEGTAEQLVADLSIVKFTTARGEERTVTVDSIEPVQVQIVCSALWASLDQETAVITWAHVRENANVDRFLADFCSRALSSVAAEQGITAVEIRSWLQRTFITELGTRGTTYQGLDETAGMPNSVVLALENHHILRAEHRSFARWYELQHDRLIEPLLQADPMEHLEAAKVARGEHSWDLVEWHAKQAVRVFGTDDLKVRAVAEHLLGEVDQNLRRSNSAREHFITAASLAEVCQDSTAVGESLAAAGRLALLDGHYAQATETLSAAIARNPGDLGVQTDLAQALWHSGQPRSALAVLTSVLTVDARFVTALRVRGEILADLGEATEALRDLERVRHQQQAGTQAARALALALAARTDAAAEEAADALANGEDDGPVLLRVAKVRALAGAPEEAVRLAAAALGATDPPLPPHLRDEAQRMLS